MKETGSPSGPRQTMRKPFEVNDIVHSDSDSWRTEKSAWVVPRLNVNDSLHFGCHLQESKIDPRHALIFAVFPVICCYFLHYSNIRLV